MTRVFASSPALGLQQSHAMSIIANTAEPSIAAGLAACAEAGVSEIVVHPYFLGPGHHTQRDIPHLVDEARRQHPEIVVRISAPLGLDDRIVDIVLERMEAAD